MFVQDESDLDQPCPQEYLDDILPIDSIPKLRAPYQCSDYFSQDDNPVWYGKVSNILPENQSLYIFGFLDLDKRQNERFTFDLEFELHIRGGE
jgi:hypothetical protein